MSKHPLWTAVGKVETGLTALGAAGLDDVPVPELRDLAAAMGRARTRIEALLGRIASGVDRSGTAAGGAAVLRDSARLPGHQARRVVKVAERLSEMPNTAAVLEAGAITLEHAAALVGAAEQCGAGLVDNDADLLERAGQTSPEMFARQARDFAARRSADRGEARLEHQRRARRASSFIDPETGMGRLAADFDPISHNLVTQAIDNRTDALYRADGGRDGQPDSVRTSRQRRADALFELITGRDATTRAPLAGEAIVDNGPVGTAVTVGTTSELSAAWPGRNRANGNGPGRNRANGNRPGASSPGPVGTAAVSRNRANGDGPGRNRANGNRFGAGVCAPNQLVVVADIGVIDGTDPDGRCEILGTGPVPPAVLARLSPDTRLAGMIFAGNGQPLWLGRSRRLANGPQHLAVAVRDRGCVDCGEPMHRCEIHHVREWSNGGHTDINNLAALCHTHHRQHHARTSGVQPRTQAGRARTRDDPP